MKRIWKDLTFIMVFAVLAPTVIVGVALDKGGGQARETTAPTEPDSSEETVAPQGPGKIPVLQTDGSIVEMEMDDYLVGVVLQEMPAEFEPEAQKAQAVVARTYALRRKTVGVKHDGGAVCTNASCCQAYISPEDYMNGGGSREAVERVREAVTATGGKVLTYDGALIEATYFSCSGGRTEDAAAVWGADVPYLQAVDSPGEENAAHFTDTVTFTAGEFAAALGTALSGSPTQWLGEVTYTDGGGVDTMVIGGVTYKGTTLRQSLGLRSTAFTMTAMGDHIVVTTRGFGHRVGMSQYGADAMAVAGSGYEEILNHYYPGAVLTDWIDKAGDLG